MTAVATGAVDRMNHSPTNRRPLKKNDTGTSTKGEIRRATRVCAATSRMEHTDVAISIVGSAETSTDVKKRASRAALPPTKPAVSVAAASMVVMRERDEEAIIPRNATLTPKPRSLLDVGRFRRM